MMMEMGIENENGDGHVKIDVQQKLVVCVYGYMYKHSQFLKVIVAVLVNPNEKESVNVH